MNGWPAMMAVWVRVPPALAGTRTLTPILPTAGADNVSWLLDEVNVHPAGASTPMNAGPPAAVALIVAGLSVNVQVVPYCVMVNGTPLIAMVPVRGVVAGLGATV